MCQKVGWTVLKENNFNTSYIIFLLCLPYSIFFCQVTSTKKKKKNADEKQHVGISTKVVCFQLI